MSFDPIKAVHKAIAGDHSFVKLAVQVQPDTSSLASLIQTSLFTAGEDRLKKKVRHVLTQASLAAGRPLTLHEWTLGLRTWREQAINSGSAARSAGQVRACRRELGKIKTQIVLCDAVVIVLQEGAALGEAPRKNFVSV